MRIVSQRKSFTLCAKDIDLFSEWLEELCLSVGVERRNCVRTRLFTEDVLLRMCDRLGSDTSFAAFFESSLGRPRLRIEARGESFNPLAGVKTELGEWDGLLRTAIGLTPQYSYDGERNILRLYIPRSGMNPVLKLGIFIALGVLIGLAGKFVVPESTRTLITDVLLMPIYDMWIRVLNGISGPIVFLTVITTMINTRRIEERGGSGRYVVVRYFLISILIVFIASICALPLHPLPLGEDDVSKYLAITLLNNILNVVPSNVFDPFVESNTSQLLFLAFVLGYMLIKLDDKVFSLKRIVQEANIVGLQLADWASQPVAIFVGFFICMEIMKNQTGILAGIWRPLVMSVCVSCVVIAATVMLVSTKTRVSPRAVAKKIEKPFVIALRTGSLNETFDEVMTSCTNLLGIEKGYAKEALPQGLVLYMPISAVGTIIFTIYTAQVFGVQASLVWYISAIVMAVVVFVATPPVPGANLLAYVVLFQTLGIPADALLDAMIFDVVFGIMAGAGNQAMLQLEMVLQAERFGLINNEKLRSRT